MLIDDIVRRAAEIRVEAREVRLDKLKNKYNKELDTAIYLFLISLVKKSYFEDNKQYVTEVEFTTEDCQKYMEIEITQDEIITMLDSCQIPFVTYCGPINAICGTEKLFVVPVVEVKE